MNDGVLALPVHGFPLTLVDVEPSALNILERLFPLFQEKALGMNGAPNVGKTPLGRTIAMAMSRHWVRKLNTGNVPGYREASEFDFFRGEAGRQNRPDIFDDGCQGNPRGNSKASAMSGTPLSPESVGALKGNLAYTFAMTSQQTPNPHRKGTPETPTSSF